MRYFVGKKVTSGDLKGEIVRCEPSIEGAAKGTDVIVCSQDKTWGEYWIDTEETYGIYRSGSEHKMDEEFFKY